jgi:hypothetical protein
MGAGGIQIRQTLVTIETQRVQLLAQKQSPTARGMELMLLES